MTRLAAWIGIALLTVYVVFFGGGWAGIYRADLRLVSTVLAGAVGVVWVVAAWRDPFWRPQSALLPAIVIVLGSLAISTAASRVERQSLEYLAYAVLLSGLYLLLVRVLAFPFFRARMGVLVVAFALVLGLAFAIANVVRWVDWWALVGHLTIPPLRPASESLTFGNPSAALTIVLLFSIPAVAALGFDRRGPRIAVSAIVVLAAFAAVVSGSRAGWFAIGISVLGVLGVVASRPTRRRGAWQVVEAWASDVRARAALILGTLVVLGGLGFLSPTIVSRIMEGGADLRFNFVLAAERMFAESPVVGTGPGSWVIQRIRYTIAPETDYYIPHAHNVYAQTAAELGTLGMLAGLALLVSVAALIRGATLDADASRRRWGWAAAIGTVYFAAHQLLDFYANMPAILFAAAIPIAWLDSSGEPSWALRSWPLPRALVGIPALVGTACFAAACIGLVVSERTALIEANAVEFANAGRWADADVAARAAVGADSGWASYDMTMGLTAANVGDHVRSAMAFRSVAESDDLPEAWLDLASEETLLGNRPAALAALERAARLGLQRPALAMAIGDLAARLGDDSLAEAAWTRALTLVPSLAGDPWWHDDPHRENLFKLVVDGAIATGDTGVKWEIALHAGEIDRARSLLPAASYPVGSLVADDVVEAWNGDEAAFQRVLATCEQNPLDPIAVGWAARLESRRGREEAADRYLRWAFVVSSAAVDLGTELRVSSSQMLGRTAQGDLAEFWGAYTYRRFTPWNLLVPSLVQLSIR